MTKQCTLLRTFTAASILSLIAGTAQAVPSVAAVSTAAQVAQEADGERHRHGPPGKGWIHDDAHSTPDTTDGSKRLKRHGPPSKGLRHWVQRDDSEAIHQPANSQRSTRYRHGPPSKYPRYRW